jgi:hypothetical protein
MIYLAVREELPTKESKFSPWISAVDNERAFDHALQFANIARHEYSCSVSRDFFRSALFGLSLHTGR